VLDDYIQSFMIQRLFGIFILLLITIHSTKLLADECTTHIEKGDKYFEGFENSEALKEYEIAYELCPDQFEPLMKLTRAYIDVGEDLKRDKSNGSRAKEAEKYLNTGIEHSKILKQKYPNNQASYFLLAVSHGSLSLFKGGRQKVKLGRNIEEYAKRAIELDPNFAPAYVVLGIYYREVAGLNGLQKAFANTFWGGLPNGTLEESKSALLKALELSPDSPYVHFDLAKTYEEMDRKDKAIEHYTKAIELPAVDHDDDRKKIISEERLVKLNNPGAEVADNNTFLKLRE